MYYNIFMSWNEKIKQARIDKGLSQQQMSDLLGIARGCYAHYEQGVREPHITLLAKICTILEISSDYLIGLSDY